MNKHSLCIILLFIIVMFIPAKGQTWKELMDSSKFYQGKQEFLTALEWSKKALVQAEKEFEEKDTNYIISIENLYYTFFDIQILDSSIFYCDKALKYYRKFYKADSEELATTISWLGYLYNSVGKYDLAEPLFKEALELRRQIFKGKHSEIAKSLNNLANSYLLQGRYSDAEPLLKESLDMMRNLYKDVHPELALYINNMGAFYSRREMYTEAEPLLKEALDMRRCLFENDHPDIAQSMDNLADFYERIGRKMDAEILNLKALEMYRKCFKGDHPELANSINSVAMYFTNIGKYKEAESLLTESMGMFKRLFKDNHPEIAMNLNNLGYLYHKMGLNNKVESFYMEALEMRRRLYQDDNPYLALSINNIASIYYELGRYSEAETLHKEALEMRRRLFKYNHSAIASSLNNLASSYHAQGRFADAELLYKEAIEMRKNIFRKQSINLSENEKNKFWSTMNGNFESFNSFALKRMQYNPDVLNTSYNNQLFTKGLLINSSQKVKNIILKSGNNDLIRKFEEWQFVRDKLAKYYKLSQKQLKDKNINLESVISSANDKEKELSLLAEGFSEAYQKKEVKFEEVQNNLQKNVSAIEIVRFKYYDKRWTDTVYYAALIIKDTSTQPELVLLKNGNELEAKYITEYRQQIEQQKKFIHNPEKIQSNLENLYTQFWAPIQEELKGIKTVYLSLDGVYNQINLNTLINPKTGKYLLDELDLRIVTSTRDLVEKKNTPLNPLSRGGNTAELFGDPQFNLDSSKYIEVASRYMNDRLRDYYYMGNNLDSLSRQGISSLPGTRKEIEKIVSDMRAKNWKVITCLGSDALEEAIKAVKSPRVLHIATHGKFLKDIEIKEERSFGMETQRYIENPLLRSMLLFTGAENTLNNPNRSNQNTEDGLLTAYEAMNLNLDNTELVVLSACETGLGEIKNGEGVYGLQRAFQVAGAKSLIMSLWTVSDQATQELMTGFYDKWLSGKEKRQAFRAAQQELKKKYPGFYYWGAFVMVGE